ncbi:hypothetical protein SLS58_000934 [Diplodia intermedia]|uniref:Uncharacterized protein n=1 Tax=Diplodia intermedia TaxID=856260 RepID=A0ABR3U3E9_9PEZI
MERQGKGVVRTEGQTEQRVMVTCPNPKCDKASWLPVQDEDDESPTAGGLDQWALSKKKSRKSKDGGAEDDFFPYFARFSAMPTPKGQPWYEGGSIQTWRALRNPHEYSQEGKWSFNDMGNFQPFFPPVPCKFTFRDCEIRDEPNLPINRARAGLVPYCFRCHQTGAVKDEDDEFVMAQSGLGMEGNLAGAGVGEIVFENPLHRFGVYNGEQQFLPDGKCWCTVKQGVAPSISWIEMRIHESLLVFVPMNTTHTAENLDAISQLQLLKPLTRATHVDVAAKTSIILPSVMNQRLVEKAAVKAATRPSRADIPCTEYKTTMASTGSRLATMVPIKAAARMTFLFE